MARHCNVPEKWPENRALAAWVKQQRRAHALGQLDAAKRRSLEWAGFEWTRNAPRRDTRGWYRALRRATGAPPRPAGAARPPKRAAREHAPAPPAGAGAAGGRALEALRRAAARGAARGARGSGLRSRIADMDLQALAAAPRAPRGRPANVRLITYPPGLVQI
jgi:hypothetical protein